MRLLVLKFFICKLNYIYVFLFLLCLSLSLCLSASLSLSLLLFAPEWNLLYKVINERNRYIASRSGFICTKIFFHRNNLLSNRLDGVAVVTFYLYVRKLNLGKVV